MFAREINQKLSELSSSKAIILSTGNSESLWARPLDWYRAITFRANDVSAFYYFAHNSIDTVTRRMLDGAIFPTDASERRMMH